MNIIAIAIGHGPKIDLGATSADGKVTERDWNADLASRIAAHLSGRADARIIHRVTERVQPVAQVNATNAVCAIELHCNAYNGVASGTEMIHHPGSKEGIRLARLLQSAAVGVLALPDRGVKGPQAGGRGSAFLANTRMPAVIVETGFIDNPRDLSVMTTRKNALALAYAEALMSFCRGLK